MHRSGLDMIVYMAAGGTTFDDGRTLVVVPTYNERENLPALVAGLRELGLPLEILVVDDNSPDGTGEIADSLASVSGNRLRVLHRSRKEGLGKAYLAGFELAIADGYKYILQMDADLSHDPAHIPAFLSEIQDCDLVLGSRYRQGSRVVNWDFKRLLLSKWATCYVRIITGMRFTDATSGFKCWRASALRTIGLREVFANGYLFQVETTYRASRQGLRIQEVPIVFHERNIGRSKMDWRVIAEAIWGVIQLRLGR